MVRESAIWSCLAASFLLLTGPAGTLQQRVCAKEQVNLHWQQTESSLALLNADKVVWQFNFPKGGKPYFHPLALLDGTELTCDSPLDNPSHHGLWFSWKYINGLDYWGEGRDTSVSPGQITVRNTKVEPRQDFSAEIVVFLNYQPPGQRHALRETRIIDVAAPDEQGAYRIKWLSAFAAETQDAVLVEKLTETRQAGEEQHEYAGLSVRAAKSITDCQLTDGHEWTKLENNTAHCVRFSGKAPQAKDFEIIIFDFLDKGRSPCPWRATITPETSYCYFGQDVLCGGPSHIEAQRGWSLAYHILIRPGPPSNTVLEEEWDRYVMWPDRRWKFGKRLADIGKALLLYANAHEDRLPGNLQDLHNSELTPEQVQWLLDNVEYLGQGVTITVNGPRDAVLAYDKTLMKEGRGTNVLFLDTHVQLVEPAKLKELGIGVKAEK
jgi:prepilin-type processing-associated H-X9-DG protein